MGGATWEDSVLAMDSGQEVKGTTERAKRLVSVEVLQPDSLWSFHQRRACKWKDRVASL